MLPSAHRLRRSNDFANTVRRGRRSSRGSVVVHLTTGEATTADPIGEPAESGTEPVKAGFVVSKAVGGAVIRNKVKRRLRHLVAARVDRLPAGSVIVVRALPAAGLTTYPELAFDLDKAIDGALRPRRRQ